MNNFGSSHDPLGYRADGNEPDCPPALDPFVCDNVLHFPASRTIIARQLAGDAPHYVLMLRDGGGRALAAPLSPSSMRNMVIQLNRAVEQLEGDAAAAAAHALGKAGFGNAASPQSLDAAVAATRVLAPGHRASSTAFLAAASIILGGALFLFAQRLAELLR